MGDVTQFPQPVYEFFPALQMHDPRTGEVSYLLQGEDGLWYDDSGDWSCDLEGLSLELTLEQCESE